MDLQRRGDGRPFLRVTSDRAVQEPFVDVILEISWSTGRLVREYTMLFDPPTMARAPAPTGPGRGAFDRRGADGTRCRGCPCGAGAGPASTAHACRAAAHGARRGGACSAGSQRPAGADEYKVRQGDTLSRIAGKTQRAGVSLDQMLVSLYRPTPRPSSRTT